MNLETKTTPKSDHMVEWALFYASIGFPIIPIYEVTTNELCACNNETCPSIGKHPRIKNGLNAASNNALIIQQWWSQWPKANIGLITGHQSGTLVLDVDVKNGGIDSLHLLEAQYGLIEGWRARSGGNGFHFYFELPKNLQIRNKVNILPGIDIRAEGGYIIAPPSRHHSGATYQWESSIEHNKIVPNWLEQLCLDPKKTSHKKKMTMPSLHNGIASVQTESICVLEGSRNSFLCSIAGSLHKYGLSHTAVFDLISHVNQVACYPTLAQSEVEKITNSVDNYPVNGMDPDIWQAPVPMQHMSIHPQCMDICLIPIPLQTWISDIAKRMQIPLELICIPAIVALGAIIGKKIQIYPKQFDNWVVHPNLWGAIVARPGTLKSPAIAEALKPLEALVKKSHTLFTEQSNQWSIQKTIKTATIEAIKDQLARCHNQNKKEESELLKAQLVQTQEEMIKSTPICKRFKTNDATVEKLVELLMANPNGLLLVRDELAGWISTLSKSGHEGSREFFLSCWCAKGSYTVDRIGRGTSHAASLCLSIFGAIQPDKLESLITTPLQSNDDGLLQRFQLLVCPEIKDKWENHDIAPDVIAQKNIENIFERIANFEPKTEEGFIGLRFSPEAQVTFNEWRENLENGLRSQDYGCGAYESHLSKYRSLIPSLALIFEILSSGSNASDVSTSSLSLALQWAEYLISHAKKVYQLDEYHGDRAAIQIFLKKIEEKKIYDGMTVRMILRNSWEHLKTKEQLESTLDFFAQNNWLKVVEHQSIGRPCRKILLNPSLLSDLSS